MPTSSRSKLLAAPEAREPEPEALAVDSPPVALGIVSMLPDPDEVAALPEEELVELADGDSAVRLPHWLLALQVV